MRDIDFLKKKKTSYMRSRKLCLFLFATAMAFFAILGVMLPIRPTESAVEKRTLAKFPEATLEGALDGTYFSDISTWYSDSFPLRDTWMSGNNVIKDAYGIRTNQIVSNGGTSDEIPTVPAKSDAASASEQTTGNTLSSEQITDAASESAGQAAKTEEAGLTQSTSDAEGAAAITDVTSNAETPSETVQTVSESDQSSSALAAITGQTSNGEYIAGDTGYGMYFFNLTAADTYINLVNRLAEYG